MGSSVRNAAKKRMAAQQKKFQASPDMAKYNQLREQAKQFGVDPSKLGNFQFGNKKNNSILEQLRSQVNTASLAQTPQRPTMTFGDAAPAALQARNQPNAIGAQLPQMQQEVKLNQPIPPQAQSQANQPSPLQPVPPKQPQQQPQQPMAQGFQPTQPQGAQQSNTTQRFQTLRNQFASQPQQVQPMQPPKPVQPPQQTQQQPASQQTQQPAQQQNPTDEEKKRLGQM